MKKLFISVILCNYNYGDFIADSIKSVISQDYTNFELIVVDDGSTDNSRKIITDYSEQYPELITKIFQENQGQAQAFNIGFQHSKGDVICFIDSDDLWIQGKLKMVNRWFCEIDDIALLQNNLMIIRDNQPTDILFKDTFNVGNVFKETCKTARIPQFVPTSGLSFQRSIIEMVMPIPRKFRICADGYLTRTSMCYGNVCAEVRPYGYYRWHANNNVLDNKKHKNDLYVNNLLIPQLNKFYESRNIQFRFPTNFPNQTYDKDFIEETLALIRIQAKSGKKSQAAFMLGKIRDCYPNDFQLRPYTYGCLYQMAGLFHEAISCFKRADRENINHINARIELASCYCALNQYNDALQEYKYIMEYDSTCFAAQMGMAYALTLCGDKEAANEVIDDIIISRPEVKNFKFSFMEMVSID